MRRQLKLKGGGIEVIGELFEKFRNKVWPKFGICAQMSDICIDSLLNAIIFEGLIQKNLSISSYYIEQVKVGLDEQLDKTMIKRINNNVIAYISGFFSYMLNSILGDLSELPNRDDDNLTYTTYIYCVFLLKDKISKILPKVAISNIQVHTLSKMIWIKFAADYRYELNMQTGEIIDIRYI